MNVKKFAIIGVIALVVIGCIVAAGCTTTSTSTDSQTVNGVTTTTTTTNGQTTTVTFTNDDLVGTWTNILGEKKYTINVKKDGSGFGEYYNNGSLQDKKEYKKVEKTNNGLKITFTDGDEYEFSLSSDKKTLTENKTGVIYVKS